MPKRAANGKLSCRAIASNLFHRRGNEATQRAQSFGVGAGSQYPGNIVYNAKICKRNEDAQMPGEFPPGPTEMGEGKWQNYLFYRKFFKDPLDYVTRWMETYGDVWHFQVGGGHNYMVANPDMAYELFVRQAKIFIKGPAYTSRTSGLARFMGEGLVTSNGDFWKRQRRLVAPAFHAMRVHAYADTMVDYTLKRLEGWRDGAVVDVDDEMMELTLNIVARTLFDADASSTVSQVKRVVAVVQKANNTASILPHWIPTPLRLRSWRANQALDKIVYGFINDRRKTGEDRGDLLSMLLLAEDVDGERMNDLQARDEAVTLFLAGHETTANTLNWAWWLLAQHPESEAKLHAELDSVLAGRAPKLEDLRRLPYTEMVIKEALRLMPAVWSVSRTASQDTEVCGYPMPRGTTAQILIYLLHRHPEHWQQPLDFLPERWADPAIENRHKYAYVPFATGPRICIGNSFATMEANLLLATIAQRYQLRLLPGAEIKPAALITMYPRDGLPMRLTARDMTK
ncbi:MAG: cytochrome P450 [Chloroflexi bacterium]|nr:cytochrome P450 [Chloroflexota bacterium]MYA94426.1 cytochrome P450 [Chloroflexota bacterium]MYE80210.1 cytochrome P450 [Chloroflexota bacterium]